MVGGNCPNCHMGVLTEDFDCCGICLAIVNIIFEINKIEYKKFILISLRYFFQLESCAVWQWFRFIF